MGRSHIKNYQKHPGARVVAVADINKNRLDLVGDEHDIKKRFTAGEELIEAAGKLELDIISIATPNKYHKTITVAALKAGCHVLCEKPMAMNTQEALEMESAARESGRRLMINFSFRFNKVADALKKQVNSGRLGEIYFARTIWLRRLGMPGFGGWFGQKSLSGGGPLIDLGVHRIDLAMWLMGYPKPVWVLGSTYNHIASRIAEKAGKDFDVEDIAIAMVKFENGATLEAEASWAANIEQKELMETRLLGTKGGVLYENENGGYGFKGSVFYESDGYQYDAKLNTDSQVAVPSAMEHFVDSILNDKPHMATAREGIIVMELLDAIYASAERGEPVKITNGRVCD